MTILRRLVVKVLNWMTNMHWSISPHGMGCVHDVCHAWEQCKAVGKCGAPHAAMSDHALRLALLIAAVTMILVALAGCGATARERWPQWREAWPNPQRQRWHEMRTLDTRNWPSKRGCMRDGCY